MDKPRILIGTSGWHYTHWKGVFYPAEVAPPDFVYVRPHGPGAAYQGSYSDAALAGWARTIEEWRRAGLDVYAYFNNDWGGYAVENAMRLRRMLDGE